MDSFTNVDPCGQLAIAPAPPMILVIDDDSDQNTTLAYCLKRQGFDVTTTTTGAQGRVLAKEVRPALILLDVQLPDDNGFAICSDLEEDPQTSDIPVLMISGSDQPQNVRQARLAGSKFYIQKPYDPNALLVLIGHALDHC